MAELGGTVEGLLLEILKPRFPSNPFIIRVPFFLIFGFKKETLK